MAYAFGGFVMGFPLIGLMAAVRLGWVDGYWSDQGLTP